MEREGTRCLIIGSGPAGYTSAIYASRASLNPVLYEGMLPGGQLTETTEIENFPGYPDGVSGVELMDALRRQAVRFGADVRSGSIASVDFSVSPYLAVTDEGHELSASTIIIATGASARYLGIPDERKYAGSGVSACATCDGFFYRGRVVGVIGGGDTACEDALYLSRLATKVYMIVRKPYLRASRVMQDRVTATANIEILFEHELMGLDGAGVVEGATLVYKSGTSLVSTKRISLDGIFLAIGHTPNTSIFVPAIKTDAGGYIITEPGGSSTNLPGVFAAGDVCDPVYRQAITSAGSGCRAAIEAERYLLGS